MSKQYDPQMVEPRIYAKWEEAGAFRPSEGGKDSFTISMPPPNATGQLHLGHAIFLSIQDVMIRQARMQGRSTLWLPGTDHAAIATESLVIKRLQAEGVERPRDTFGREGLLAKIKEYVEGSRATIRNQVRRMGSSCDWSRERYTLDAALNRCVGEVFQKMYQDGLLYRGSRIVNWDPAMQTTVSDDELERVEENVPFYTFQFGPFQISTARPETKFGDKYVVMHPEDARYAQYQTGDTFECEWLSGKITATVIKDAAIDPEFGTGVMTITPWHDATDFDIATRHGLQGVQVIDLEGKLLPIAGEFAGRDRIEARAAIVDKLAAKGLLVSVDKEYRHSIALNYRGKGVIEPQIMPQWFIDVNKPVQTWQNDRWQGKSLKQVMRQVVEEKGQVEGITILPERFEKTYFHWIDNLRDWCVSRQIWWGHQIPAWYRKSVLSGDASLPVSMRLPANLDPQDIHVGVTPPAEEDLWIQDPDTLDTWFSSALWTWSTLVDPTKAEDTTLSLADLLSQSPDFNRFHPTQVMETGYDILFFWVARMILMTTYAIGQIPFQTVYLHGLVRTRDGSKMSKSNPESVIDPLDMIDKYGTDALRLALVIGTTPGNDARLYEEKIAGYRNFCNKLWNASRFVLDAKEADFYEKISFAEAELGAMDKFQRAILGQMDMLRGEIDKHLAAYNIGQAAEAIYAFVWSDFCDWFIERQKEELNAADQKRVNRSYFVLCQVLEGVLKLLHPFAPFITEEIWQQLSERVRPMRQGISSDEDSQSGLLMQASWPQSEFEDQTTSIAAIDLVKQFIVKVRGIKAELKLTTARGEIRLASGDEETRQAIIENLLFIPQAVGFKATATLVESLPADLSPEFIQVSVGGIEGAVRFDAEVDTETKQARLRKELEEVERAILRLEQLLGNPSFIQKAPSSVVQSEQARLSVLQEERTLLLNGLNADA